MEMYQEYQKGWIEVVCGCMFAGKSEELIRRIKTLEFAHKNILVFKPKIDDRYSKEFVSSHAGSKMKCYPIDNASEILKYVNDEIDVVAVDEVQFFDKSIIAISEKLANKGIRVILAGLDKNFRGEPFGVMGEIITRAEFVTKLSAVCVKCGAPATRTQRLINGEAASYNEPEILVGASEAYEPRCRHCHEVKNAPKI